MKSGDDDAEEVPLDLRLVVGGVIAAVVVAVGGFTLITSLNPSRDYYAIPIGEVPSGPGPTTTIPVHDLDQDGNADVAVIEGQVVHIPKDAPVDDGGLLQWSDLIGSLGGASLAAIGGIGAAIVGRRSGRSQVRDLAARVDALEDALRSYVAQKNASSSGQPHTPESRRHSPASPDGDRSRQRGSSRMRSLLRFWT